MIDSVWYFPGDGPLPDLALLLGVMLALAGALLGAVACLLVRQSRTAFRAALLSALPGCIVAAPGLVIVGHRHFGAWHDVRVAIRQYNASILRDAPRDRVLTDQEFAALRAKHLPEPVPLWFPGWTRPVHLRMAHGVSPFVGVDFDDGAHAAFDPLTMLCTYSD